MTVIEHHRLSRQATVIIPVFNAAGTIDAQLEALSRQETVVDFEVLIVDNGSTDGSVRLAQAHLPNLTKLKLIDASDGTGAYYARNAGAAAADGEVLLFCDADDIVGTEWVDAMWRSLMFADMVGGPVRPLVAAGLKSAVVPGAELPTTGPVRLLGFLPFSITANFGIRKSVFEHLGGFDANYKNGGDADLCWRAQLSGFQLAFAERALVEYRLRPSGASTASQYYRYALAHPALFRRFRAHGMTRRNSVAVLRSWAGAIARVPLLPVLGTRRRRDWIIRAATLSGRAIGSARAHTLYL